MDPVLAKNFAKLFIKEVQSFAVRRLKNLTKNIKKDGKSITKEFNRLSSIFNSKKNNVVIHHAEFGSNKNPLIGMTVMGHIDTNPGVDREEDMLGVWQYYINKIPPKFIFSNVIQFTIGSHVIQRIMERHPEIENFEFDTAFDIVRSELQYAPIYCTIIKMFLTLGTGTGALPNVLVEGEHPVVFPIPSEHGIFICHVNRGIPSLRTFLSINELNDDQCRLRSKMLELTAQYRSINFPYVLNKIMEFEADNKMFLLFFYISAIFYDFKEIFLSVLPICIGDGFPEGQKKHVIEKLIKYVEIFPVPHPEKDLEYRNSSLKNAIAEKRELKLTRKWMIQVNRISQTKEFLVKK